MRIIQKFEVSYRIKRKENFLLGPKLMDIKRTKAQNGIIKYYAYSTVTKALHIRLAYAY